MPLPPIGPTLAISDAAHGGNAHFYFLPPLVPVPTPTGTFDPSQLPEVSVCRFVRGECAEEIAHFSSASSPAITVDPVGEAYNVVWQTKGAGLLTTEAYRIRVLVGSVLLGFADFQVVVDKKDLTDLPADVIGLVQEKPLQVKFRIEEGLVGTIRVIPGSQEIEAKATQQYQVLYFDLHGQPLPGGYPITWATSDPTVLTIDQTGVATGQAIGQAQVAATTAGLTSPPAIATVFRRIVFTSDRDGNSEIYVMRSSGSGQTRLTYNLSADADASWSPDGQKIAFVRQGAAGSEIWTMDATGGNQAPRSSPVEGLPYAANPRWSPDGAYLAFLRSATPGGAGDLYRVATAGATQQGLTSSGDVVGVPAWSPSGTQLAIVRGASLDAFLYTVNADGTGMTPQAPAYGIAAPSLVATATPEPAWAPGPAILYVDLVDSDADDNYIREVFSLVPGGAGPTQLTSLNLSFSDDGASTVRWSPDASRILMSAQEAEHVGIHIMQPSGAQLTELTEGTPGGVGSTDRGFDPDMKRILFHRNTTGFALDFQVWLMKPDGTESTQLTTQGVNQDPDWRP